MKFNKFVALVPATLLAFSLVACGNDNPTPTPVPTPVPTAPTPQPQPQPRPQPNTGYTATEQQFLNSLYSASSTFSGYNDSDLVAAGYQVCSLFDAGYTVDETIYEVYNGTGLDQYDTGVLIGASVTSLCTEYYPLVESWINANG